MSDSFVSHSGRARPEISVEEYLSNCLMYPREYVFRGHGAHTWDLIPSAYRSHDSKPLSRTERENRNLYFSSDRFVLDFERLSDIGAAREGLVLKDSNYKTLQKIVFFQHLGIPTPLLDWTDSPLIALFMAYTFRPSGSKVLRIFRLNTSILPKLLMMQNYETIGFDRIRSQRGAVSFFGQLDKDSINITTMTFDEYMAEKKTERFLYRVDIKLGKDGPDLIEKALSANGFTLETMFPNSPYWLGQAISSRLPWAKPDDLGV